MHYQPPQRVLHAIEEWESAARCLLSTRYGKVRVVISAATLLKDVFDLFQTDFERTAPEIAEDILHSELVSLAAAQRTQSQIAAVREATSDIYNPDDPESVEAFHAYLFDVLWAPYDAGAFEEAKSRLTNRLFENGFNEQYFADKRCIDLGCGGGRFSIAMGQLGAAEVLGLDVGEKSLHSARKWTETYQLTNTRFEEGSCYNTNRPDGSFDFVVSNGVAHHHTRFNDALTEFHRILAKDGVLWLYVTGPGDNIWSYLSQIILRVMRCIPVEVAKQTLELCNFPSAAYYHVMDGMYAVYFYRSLAEIKEALLDAGFSRVEPMKYKPGIDLTPLPEDPDRFGAGDIRILAYK